MKSKTISYLLYLMAVVVMMTAFSIPVFAQVPDSVKNT